MGQSWNSSHPHQQQKIVDPGKNDGCLCTSHLQKTISYQITSVLYLSLTKSNCSQNAALKHPAILVIIFSFWCVVKLKPTEKKRNQKLNIWASKIHIQGMPEGLHLSRKAIAYLIWFLVAAFSKWVPYGNIFYPAQF